MYLCVQILLACLLWSISGCSSGIVIVSPSHHLVLSHVCHPFSTQTTCLLLCLGSWSLAGMVMDEDVMKVALLKDVQGDGEEFKDGWDSIEQ